MDISYCFVPPENDYHSPHIRIVSKMINCHNFVMNAHDVCTIVMMYSMMMDSTIKCICALL